MRRKRAAPAGTTGAEVREPLKVLAKWPAACREDQECVIGEIRYPAPAGLDADQVMWWIDFVEMRVNASRSLLNGFTGAVIGAVLATAVGATAIWVSDAPWKMAVTVTLSMIVVLGAAGTLLKDSDHQPLEQRLVLYRQRSRDLARRGSVDARARRRTRRRRGW